MFREAVILAGGFGTRLSHVLGNIPKPMAPVYGKPFLCYLLDRLADSGVQHVVLATGHLHEQIESYFHDGYRGIKVSFSNESTPLFTGGAIAKAANYIESEDFLVLNGDTLFDIDLAAFYEFHCSRKAHLSVALREVPDTGRYGAVECVDGCITAFREKEQSSGAGCINGGIYAISHEWLMQQSLPEKFSFEKELMQPLAGAEGFSGMRFSDYFIDIGVPEDYYRAQKEFGALFPKDTTLFLDRDGVLNRHIVGDYVRNWQMWEWIPGAREAVAALSKLYKRIIIISNQQGVGKGLMSQADLDNIHANMLRDIEAVGGRIDKVYTCTDLQDSGSPNRKPAIGMALQAQRDFPDIDLHRAVMVGDSLSDMLFARNAHTRAFYISKNKPVPEKVQDYTDLVANDLQELAQLFVS